MKQKLSTNPFPAGFPPELRAKAFVDSDEAAWHPLLAIQVTVWLSGHGYAVLGTEAWRLESTGIQSLPFWQSVSREDNEEWSSFVSRAGAETSGYLRALAPKVAKEGNVYVNVTWASESEFQNLK